MGESPCGPQTRILATGFERLDAEIRKLELQLAPQFAPRSVAQYHPVRPDPDPDGGGGMTADVDKLLAQVGISAG